MNTASTIQEVARETGVAAEADVVVCGAGPAGVAAAIAAARTGATVQLLEVHGCLGGVWTSGLLACILDVAKPGLISEIVSTLEARGARCGKNYDPEAMKLLLEQLCSDAGVAIQLHTRVVATQRHGQRLAAVMTESKSGRQAWRGKVFIDATGDGDLAALAGCSWSMGQADTGLVQPMSLMALVTGLKTAEVERFIARSYDNKASLLAEMERAGVMPSYTRPTLFHVREDLFALMANHEYGVSALDAAKITQATINARAELHAMIPALRALGGVWANIQLITTADQIGVREGRRIRGRYTVTVKDLIEGRHHDDAVCRVNFPVDVHSIQRADGGAYTESGVRAKPYDIPLRALIAADVDGLMMAGRCISGDFLAHASYRVTGNAVAMGEAAGVTAALAARLDVDPHEVPWTEVQASLNHQPEYVSP